MARRRRGTPQEVFLSHSARDQRFVSRIADVLGEHGVPVWYSATNILGAQQWHDEIGAALNRCDWFVVVLSPSSVKSRWVKREVLFALNDKRFEDRIVPVLFKNCDFGRLSWTLQALQLVSFLDGFDAGCRALLRVWGKGHGRL